MNPEHDRNLLQSAPTPILRNTLLRNGDVQIQALKFIVAGCWIVGSPTYENLAFFLNTSSAECGRIERIGQGVLRLTVSPSFVDCCVWNTSEVSKLVSLVVFADNFAPEGREILRRLHFEEVGIQGDLTHSIQ